MKLIFIFYLRRNSSIKILNDVYMHMYILRALHKYIYIFVSPKTSLIKIIAFIVKISMRK